MPEINWWCIYHEGKPVCEPIPEYKAIKKYKELSRHIANLDLRLLQQTGEIKSAQEVINLRVVGD